ncbi:MAG: Na/Pi cotransporter family protein [Deltaproteobacteria bacterium]|nr:Na/Pi cotransporter family protein [Deltaproteobacteria bacterium]
MEIDVFDMIVGIFGGLALFLYGMKVMSDGLQKVAGEKMRSVLSVMTSNRLAGVGTGFAVTSVIQSSSATTVMLVGFVNAGLLTLNQSIGVIMGANIGTTATAWLVSLFGFKVKISLMALPAIAIGFIPKFTGQKKLAEWGDVLIGFGILFIGLGFMKDAVSVLKNAPEVELWIANYCTANTLLSRFIPLLIGMLFTFVVQSSSAAMAVTMTMAAQGVIDIPTACALALGQNIGTTITANLAAIGTSAAAKQAAMAHFLFNFLGSIWPIVFFMPFLSLIDIIYPVASSIDFATIQKISDPEKLAAATKAAAFPITVHLAIFHSLFNIVNTLLFLPFTNQLAWLSTKLVASGSQKEETHLRFIDPKVIESPPMALHAARAELKSMLQEVEEMFKQVLYLVSHPNDKKGKVAKDILKREKRVDMLEKEILEYLVSVTQLELSMDQSHEVGGIQQCVSDVERMGDHCESLLYLAQKRYEKKLPISEEAMKDILEIGHEVESFITMLVNHIFDASGNLMKQSITYEDNINRLRKHIRKGHIKRLNAQTCTVQQGLIFIDMLTSFEKMGDHAFNVAEVFAGER